MALLFLLLQEQLELRTTRRVVVDIGKQPVVNPHAGDGPHHGSSRLIMPFLLAYYGSPPYLTSNWILQHSLKSTSTEPISKSIYSYGTHLLPEASGNYLE